jgi:predicted site-specific integrase-resolvase
MVELDGDLTRKTWTVAESAEAAGVDPTVIRQWKRRGKLQPVNPGRGRPRFRAIDVLKTEAATRERAHRAA